METSIEGSSVEVRYAGVIVGRGAVVRDLGGEGVFVGIPEPMPVGTLVTLTIGDSVRPAIVDEVVEAAEPSTVGMRVRWGGAAAPAPRRAPVRPAPVVVPEVVPAAAPVAATSVPSGEAPLVNVAPAELESDASDAGGASDGPIAAPLSLAGPSGSSQQGGGKKRRKRR